VNAVTIQSGMEELKRRLEVLLGARPEAPLDVSEKTRLENEAREAATRRERVSEAGGQLLASAFGFLAQLVPPPTDSAATLALSSRMQEQLSHCMEKDEQGRMRMTITLPDPAFLASLSDALARLVGFSQQSNPRTT